MPRQRLSEMISRMITKQQCPTHELPLKYYCPSREKIVCQECHAEEVIGIKQLIQNPMRIMLQFEQMSHPIYNCYRNHEKYELMFRGLKSFTEALREKVGSYCDRILEKFSSMWESVKCQKKSEILKIIDAEKRYCSEFELMLQEGFQNGRPNQLQAIIKEFKQKSDDPTHYIEVNLQSVREECLKIPIINWDALRNLYSRICDPYSWELDKFFCISNENNLKESTFSDTTFKNENSCQQNKISFQVPLLKDLIPSIENPLRDPSFSLFYDSKTTKLLHNLEPSHDDSLNTEFVRGTSSKEQFCIQIANDSYCELDQYRLLGINYESLTLFSYATGKLQTINTFSIPGCTGVLAFRECLIVVASGRVWRIWLNDGYMEVLAMAHGDLSYLSEHSFSFEGTSQKTISKHAYHGGQIEEAS